MNDFLKNNNIILIAIGAVPGSILRWQIDQIFLVNLFGCFLLGFINGMSISERYKLIFGFGFCGSLTTFSGLSLQLFQLISQGLYKHFFLNLTSLFLIGFFVIGLGHYLAKKIQIS